jgi:hypothetical protein
LSFDSLEQEKGIVMPNSNRKNVFISVGGRYTSEQESFLEGLVSLLERDVGIITRIMNVTDYPTGNPLKDISDVMRQCHGVIVVAFERKYFPSGIEKRGSSQESLLRDTRYTTPWNQIEASMAFTLGLPILVLSENGLHGEGLLEEKYDWYVEHIDINRDALAIRGVKTRVRVWCEKLNTTIDTSRTPTPIDEQLTIQQLVKSLRLKTMIQVIVIIAAVFTGGVAAGGWLRPFFPAQSVSSQR